jgi:hypothetical protein
MGHYWLPLAQEAKFALFAPTKDSTMKKPSFSLITVSVFTFLFFTTQVAFAQTQTQPQTSTVKPARAQVKPAETMTLNYSKVPANKRYVVYDAKGNQIMDLKAGSSTAEITDCAQVPCPPTFGDDVVCWKCVERIAAPSSGTDE